MCLDPSAQWQKVPSQHIVSISLLKYADNIIVDKETQIFATNLGSWVIPGALCAALYLAMSLPLAALARVLERRWRWGTA